MSLDNIKLLFEEFIEAPSFNDVGFSGNILVTKENKRLIDFLINEEFFETDDDIDCGENINLAFNTNSIRHISPKVAISYQHYYRFLSKGEYDANTPIIEEIAENYFNCQSESRKKIQSFVHLITTLKKCFYFNDKKTIVLFSSKALEIDIPDPDSIDKIIKIELSDLEDINKFIEWLEVVNEDGEKVFNIHKKEVTTSILSKALTEHPKSESLFALINNISTLLTDCQKSYELYVDEFTYSKFSKKLEENALNFYEKINNVMTSLRNQVISLPLLYTLFRYSKLPEDDFVRFSFLAYSLVIFLSIVQHFFYLTGLNKEFYRFYDKHHKTKGLSKDIEQIRKTFCWQRNLQWCVYVALIFIVSLTMVFACDYEPPQNNQSSVISSQIKS